MQTHQTGCLKGNRLGSVLTRTSWIFPFSAPLTSGVSQKICTIPAGPNAVGGLSVIQPSPAAYKVRIVVITSSDAVTSDQIDLGTSSGGNQLLAAQNLKAASGTMYSSPPNDFTIVKADTEIWITETIVGAKTVGEFAVVVEPFELNTLPIRTQET